MDGQMNLFDMHAGEEEQKPHKYSWQRYIGQRVRFCGSCVGTLRGVTGTVVKTEPYYTDVMTEYGARTGTPTTIEPAEEGSEK